MRLGIMAFANQSGLGYQTRRLTYMLNPYRILLVDSTSFSKNKEQYPSWYKHYSGYKVAGFPSDREIRKFLQGLTHVLVCETTLNPNFTAIAKQMGVKVFIQENWEFNDFLINRRMVLPEKFLVPSYWKLQEMIDLFGEDKVVYLPPPIDPDEFEVATNENLRRNGRRFLHVVGTLATHDRNGTLDLLEAVKLAKSDFELVIRSQRELPPEYIIDDPRVIYEQTNMGKPADMYIGFDAMFLPRRYGGLCLVCNEALASGLPVIMTDISPNSELLYSEWVVESRVIEKILTRTYIDVYSANAALLAKKIDQFADMNSSELLAEKERAFELYYMNFSPDVLIHEYNKLWT